MARIQATTNNYVPSGTTRTIVTGPGAIHSILICHNSTTPGTCTLYDNTSAAAPTLMIFTVSAYNPILFNFKDIGPIRFTTGLTIVNTSGTTCFVVTEE